jgi:hypothetical protein
MADRQAQDRDAEQWVRVYVGQQLSFSETAVSLAHKLAVPVPPARRVLAALAEAGELSRRSFGWRIEPIYYKDRAQRERAGAAYRAA